MDTTADNVVEATAATHSAASATPAATAATKSRTLMESFREAGEKLCCSKKQSSGNELFC